MFKKLGLKRLSLIGLLLGLALVSALIAWQGVGHVASILASAGSSLLLLLVFYPPHLACGALSWWLLLPKDQRPSVLAVASFLWMGQSVSGLLPTTKLGAEVVKTRMLMKAKVGGAEAVAAAVVQNAIQGMTVVLWSLIGLAALVALSADVDVIAMAGGALAVFACGIVAMVVLLRRGMLVPLLGFVQRLVKRELIKDLDTKTAKLDQAVRVALERPWLVAACCLLRLAGRFARAGEVWLAAILLGSPITFMEAVMLRSLTTMVRSFTFFVPSGIGVQEAAFMALGGAVGLAPDLMLTVSLATRVKRIVLGIPGLIVYQLAEGRDFLRRWRKPTEAPALQPAAESEVPDAGDSRSA